MLPTSEVDVEATRDCETVCSRPPVCVVPRRRETSLQSSHESAFTEVTSIGIRERDGDEDDNDELLNLLLGKREELLSEFREVERCLNRDCSLV